MDITIIQEREGVKDFSNVKPADVVILPAFGASLQEMMLLSDRGVNIVDTTCPWVSKVASQIGVCNARQLVWLVSLPFVSYLQLAFL